MQIINSQAENVIFEHNVVKTLRIVILDEDKFFTAGLKAVLSSYLKFRSWKAEFLYDYIPGRKIDILFESTCHGSAMRFSCSSVSHCFAFADRRNNHLDYIINNTDKFNILYRHYPVLAVLQFIGNALFADQEPPKQIENTRFLRHQLLTRREREVLLYLKKGSTPAVIAASMGIAERTVSTHKRAAMRKLNFTRSIELHQWMHLSDKNAGS